MSSDPVAVAAESIRAQFAVSGQASVRRADLTFSLSLWRALAQAVGTDLGRQVRFSHEFATTRAHLIGWPHDSAEAEHDGKARKAAAAAVHQIASANPA